MVKILMSIQDDVSALEEFVEEDIWGNIKEFLNWGLHIGEGENSVHLTIGLLLLLIVAFIITNIVLKWFRHLLTRRMEGDDKLKFFSIFQFIKYVVYVAVILFVMSAAGINITLLLTASAVIFVGLGLALQELFQDLIGGIYIIVDKSLRVGDIIEVDGKVGKVIEIELRSTRALTRDDKVIIVPNHVFMSDIVFNYTQNRKTTRESVSVGVAYGSDVGLVTQLLIECVEKEGAIEKVPKPFVLFDDFGDSALLFSVHFFIKDSFQALKIKSRIRYSIDEHFRNNNIKIPFPQRDVHLFQARSVSVQGDSDKNLKETN